MGKFDWKRFLGKLAPTIGAAVGGPMGGIATKFLADKWLGKSDATEEDIELALQSASPESLLELKKLEQDFKVQMKELDIDVFRAEIEDRDSARKLFNINIWPQIALSAVFILGYFATLYFVLTELQGVTLDEGIKAIAFSLMGVMTAEVTRVMAFWFGSSLGSKEKTAKIGKEKE